MRAQPAPTLQEGVRLQEVGFIGFYIPPRHASKFGTNKEYQEAGDANQGWQVPASQVGNFIPLITQNNQNAETFLRNTTQEKQIQKPQTKVDRPTYKGFPHPGPDRWERVG